MLQLLYQVWVDGFFYNLKIENLFAPFFKEIYIFSALLILSIIEIIFGGWKKSSLSLVLFSGRTGYWDFFSFAIYTIGVRRFLTNIFTFGFMALFFTLFYKNGLFIYQIKIINEWPLWLKYIIIIILYDFLFYWSHRIKHASNWLWNAHEFHHSSTMVNLLTTYRSHPIDSVLYQFTIASPLCFIFDLTLTSSVFFMLVTGIFGLINHSRIDSDFGKIGKNIFVSPRMHHSHHSIEIANYNYGEIFVFWDKLFGTYKEPQKSIQNIQQGIANNFYENDLMPIAFLKPVYRIYHNIFKSIFANLVFIKKSKL